jgi:hypothetical protein
MSYIGNVGHLGTSINSDVSKYTYEYIATAGQTVFTGADINSATLGYTVGNIIVTYGGADLAYSDYVATDGVSIVLADGALVGKIIRVIAFQAFEIADTYTQAQTDTLLGANVQTKADIEGLGIAASSITGALPAIDGSLLTNLPSGGGKVLQVITKNGLEFSRTNSTSYVASTLFADITPISPTSKMVVCFNSKLWVNGDGGNCRGYVKIYCNGVDVDANYYKSVRPSTGYNDQQIYTMLPTATRLTHTHNSNVLLQYRLYMKTVITGSGTTYAWTYAENQEDYYDITIFEIEQ